jgi:hypothetical protein
MGIDPSSGKHYDTPSMEGQMGNDCEILRNLQVLSLEDRQRVAKYVESLAAAKPLHPLKNPRGMFAHRGIDIPPEVIDEARREMWVNISPPAAPTDA